MKCRVLLCFLVASLSACAPSFDKRFEEGTQLYQNGKYKEAISIFEELRERDASNINLYPKLTVAYAETGNWEKCIHFGQTSLEKGADFFEVYAQLIQCNFKNNQVPAALDYYNEALKKYPDRKDFGRDIGTNLLKYQQHEAAAQILAPLAQSSTTDENLHYYTGLAYEKSGKLEQAESFYRSALAINDHHSNSFFGLASIYENQGKIDEAITEYKKAVEYDTDHLSALLNLAQLQEKKSPEEAVVSWKLYITAAKEKDPDSSFLAHAKTYVEKAEGGPAKSP